MRFLTNTTKESKNHLYERLIQCGFTLEKQEIFTSLTASYQFIQRNNLKYGFEYLNIQFKVYDQTTFMFGSLAPCCYLRNQHLKILKDFLGTRKKLMLL